MEFPSAAQDGGEGEPGMDALAARIALGREIRSEAERIVATRGELAEASAWLAARAKGLGDGDRAFREAVAGRVSRILALARHDRVH